MIMRTAAPFVVLLAVSLSTAPSPEVLRVREWRAQNEGAILTELMQLVAVPNVASDLTEQ
jgi:hypothetical protein